MLNKAFIGHFSTALSMAGAVGILAILLVLATAPTPDQFRNLANNTRYLSGAINSLGNGVAVSNAQGQALGARAEQLSAALEQGGVAIGRDVQQLYAPVAPLDVARWPMMEGLNVIDTRGITLNDPAAVLDAQTKLAGGLDMMREHLGEFAQVQGELLEMLASFSESANTVVGGFRGRGQGRIADSVYVSTQQIQKSILSGSPRELERVLITIDQLQADEARAQADDRGAVRLLINSAYTMISLRRTMNQAELLMDAQGVQASLEGLVSLATQDQLYVLSAVNDARVLLNVYTVLMMAVLAFFGLRLRASHSALNRSHDDLEVRVEERTADLEQANENLKESQVQLVQAEKMSSLGQLVAGVMHEINTPLLYVLNNTTVTAEAVADVAKYVEATFPILTAQDSDTGRAAIQQLLARRDEFDVDELRENMSEAESLVEDSVDGLNQISDLVQSLKDFSRLDRVADDKFDVREGIEKTLTITRNMLKYGVTVEKNLEPIPEIYCSPSRLNQVFINIVTNAVQAMDGEGTLRIRTSQVQSAAGESVEIVFEDTGCGIEEAHLAKIMDPFFTTKPVGQGTGLGLSIVAQIVEQHAGTILVDSKVGSGTRITINLPAGERPQLGETGPEESPVDHDDQAA